MTKRAGMLPNSFPWAPKAGSSLFNWDGLACYLRGPASPTWVWGLRHVCFPKEKMSFVLSEKKDLQSPQ